MIRSYSEHAANERTFLAWVRTAIAVIAFGFVIEKFDLFVLTMANANSPDSGRRLLLQRLSGPLGRYDGLALILVGLALMVVAALRFCPYGRLLDDPEMHPAAGVRAELLLSAALAVIVAGFSAYLVLG
jgi:putative membrane protein